MSGVYARIPTPSCSHTGTMSTSTDRHSRLYGTCTIHHFKYKVQRLSVIFIQISSILSDFDTQSLVCNSKFIIFAPGWWAAVGLAPSPAW